MPYGSCGYTNSDGTIPFARDAVAAAADQNNDYEGSCGRCYQVGRLAWWAGARPTPCLTTTAAARAHVRSRKRVQHQRCARARERHPSRPTCVAQVRCRSGLILDNDLLPLDIRAPYMTYLPDINRTVSAPVVQFCSIILILNTKFCLYYDRETIAARG